VGKRKTENSTDRGKAKAVVKFITISDLQSCAKLEGTTSVHQQVGCIADSCKRHPAGMFVTSSRGTVSKKIDTGF
jgi:hypothetical protein